MRKLSLGRKDRRQGETSSASLACLGITSACGILDLEFLEPINGIVMLIKIRPPLLHSSYVLGGVLGAQFIFVFNLQKIFRTVVTNIFILMLKRLRHSEVVKQVKRERGARASRW